MTARADRRDALFDLLVSRPAGLTQAEIELLLPCRPDQAKQAIHDLRLFLGEFDDVNLPCSPQPGGGQWIYQLSGNLDDAREWFANRIGDAESRLRVMHAMFASIAKGTDVRTSDGRKARLIERGLRRVVEDLDDLIIA
jgi:hypothetical protein